MSVLAAVLAVRMLRCVHSRQGWCLVIAALIYALLCACPPSACHLQMPERSRLASCDISTDVQYCVMMVFKGNSMPKPVNVFRALAKMRAAV